MDKKKYLGYGGVGDCFIIILKLIEDGGDFIYTHVEKNKSKLRMCGELLTSYNIEHELINTNNIRGWWSKYSKRYDKHFNMFAAGHINVPSKPYHWEPCKDNGYKNPFNPNMKEKTNKVCVQVNGGIGITTRHLFNRPIVDYITKDFNQDDVVWIGTEKDFDPPFGKNLSGKLSLEETFEEISTASYFVGFNSVLLYWSLYNKINCHLFMDHQGKYDTRIHEEHKQYLTYIEN